MNIHSFLLAFLLMLLLLIGVFGAPKTSGNAPPKEQNAEEGAKVEIDLTAKQMTIYTGNIKNYMARKCPNIEKHHLGTKENPFWSNELMDEIKKCIGNMKIAGLVDEFFKKSGQQQQQAEQKLVVKEANEFLEKLLEKVLQKVLGKEKIPMKQQELEKLSKEQQLLILHELFVVGELFEKKMEEDGSVGKEQNDNNGQKEFNFIKFNAAVFVTEKKLQDIKTKVFLRFDLKQYFVFTEELAKHEALTEISFTKQEMTVFVQKLNNFISERAKDCINTGVTTIPNTFKQNIAQVNIVNLLKEFDEKNQNQHPEQFLKKLLPKLLEKLLKKEIISIDQELKNLKNTQHVYILRELLVIGEHLEEKLEEYGGIGREKIGYGNTVIDFGYHAELKAQLSIAKNMTDEILKYISDFPSFDLKEYYVVHLPTNVPKYEQTQIKVQLSLGQIAVFIENMDNFLQSKCLVNEALTEDKVKKTELKKCISELKILEIRNLFKNESTKGQQQQKTNDFLESILEKISDSKNQKNQLREINNLKDGQNLLVLLKLAKLSRFLNEILYKKLDELNCVILQMFDLNFYAKTEKTFELIEFIARRKLKKDFEESFNTMYYAYEPIHLGIPFLDYKSGDLNELRRENISGVKLKAKIEIGALAKMIELIGQFFNQNYEQNVLKEFEDENKLKNYVKKVNFAELGKKFKDEELKKNNKTLYFANLIFSILKDEASENKSEKQQLYPFDMDIYKIDDAGMKQSILKGLCQFVRLYAQMFGNLTIENHELNDGDVTIIWKNLPIQIEMVFQEYGANEMSAIQKALKKAGIFDALGDEMHKTDETLLKDTAIPDEETQADKSVNDL